MRLPEHLSNNGDESQTSRLIGESEVNNGFRASFMNECHLLIRPRLMRSFMCSYIYPFQIVFKSSFIDIVTLLVTNAYNKPIMWALKTNAIRRLVAQPTYGVLQPNSTVQVFCLSAAFGSMNSKFCALYREGHVVLIKSALFASLQKCCCTSG